MKWFAETTEWPGITAPNHVYLLDDSKSKMFAYVKFGRGLPEKFSKPIPNAEQLVYRSRLYAEYIVKMEKHNADPAQTWQIGVNQFSDLTKEEFMSTYLG